MSGTVLVTGAAGFIGFHLCRALLAAGERVWGFDSLNDYYDPRLKAARLDILCRSKRFRFTLGRLEDEAAVTKLFEEAAPAAVYHLGAQAGVRYSIENPRAYIETNLVGTFHILEALRRRPAEHLLFASSSSVYGDGAEPPFAVDADTDRPVSLYAATKKADELMAYAYAKLYGIPATGLRFFTVYGPFGRPDMAYFSFTQRILAGETIDVFNHGELMRDFTYIDDVVEGLTALKARPPAPDAQGARYKVYNLGNNRPEKLGDFIRALEEALGREARIRYLPMQPGDVHVTAADISESAADFGFAPKTGLREGLKRFAEWYRSYYNV
ncbi:MAG: NAD-dependent epimerase/dehydratase family protein [Clostridia bacterium]|nr:NAD-dependent epimerase/dehydratase family protein [Clostridia bacterium]